MSSDPRAEAQQTGYDLFLNSLNQRQNLSLQALAQFLGQPIPATGGISRTTINVQQAPAAPAAPADSTLPAIAPQGAGAPGTPAGPQTTAGANAVPPAGQPAAIPVAQPVAIAAPATATTALPTNGNLSGLLKTAALGAGLFAGGGIGLGAFNLLSGLVANRSAVPVAPVVIQQPAAAAQQQIEQAWRAALVDKNGDPIKIQNPVQPPAQ